MKFCNNKWTTKEGLNFKNYEMWFGLQNLKKAMLFFYTFFSLEKILFKSKIIFLFLVPID